MIKKYNDFCEFLNDKFLDDIYNSINKYFIHNKELFNLHSKTINNPFYSRIDDLLVTSYYAESTENDLLTIKATVRLDIIIKGKLEGIIKDIEDDTIFRYVEIIFKINLYNFNNKIYISEVNYIDLKSKYNKNESSSKNLIPYISDNLDYYANKILEKVYKNKLNSLSKINVKELVEFFGLRIKEMELTNDIYGKIYFFDSNEVSSKTIVIDKKKSYLYGIGFAKFTIVHEIIHWFYHRNFFYLQRLINPNSTSISCAIENSNYYKNKYNKEFKIMEWQANSLASRILMPSKTTNIIYNELYEKYEIIYGNNLIKIYESILYDIADFFKVSKMLTKIRLIQLGHYEFLGIHDILKNNMISYIPTKIIDPCFSYRIDFNDFCFSIVTNDILYKAYAERKLIYTNGFLVLNDEKYVIIEDNKFKIKDESLSKIDEFAIRFKKDINEIIDINDIYSISYLCRKNMNGSKLVNNFVLDEHNEELIKKFEHIKSFKEDDEESREIVDKLRCSFSEAINVLLYEFNSTENHLAKLSKVDHKVINNYRLGKVKNPDYKKIIAICAGLNLRPSVSRALLKTINIDLTDAVNSIDRFYNLLLTEKYEYSIEEWNVMIKMAGFTDKDLLP